MGAKGGGGKLGFGGNMLGGAAQSTSTMLGNTLGSSVASTTSAAAPAAAAASTAASAGNPLNLSMDSLPKDVTLYNENNLPINRSISGGSVGNIRPYKSLHTGDGKAWSPSATPNATAAPSVGAPLQANPSPVQAGSPQPTTGLPLAPLNGPTPPSIASAMEFNGGAGAGLGAQVGGPLQMTQPNVPTGPQISQPAMFGQQTFNMAPNPGMSPELTVPPGVNNDEMLFVPTRPGPDVVNPTPKGVTLDGGVINYSPLPSPPRELVEAQKFGAPAPLGQPPLGAPIAPAAPLPSGLGYSPEYQQGLFPSSPKAEVPSFAPPVPGFGQPMPAIPSSPVGQAGGVLGPLQVPSAAPPVPGFGQPMLAVPVEGNMSITPNSIGNVFGAQKEAPIEAAPISGTPVPNTISSGHMNLPANQGSMPKNSQYLSQAGLDRIKHIESRGNPNAVSPTGAKGLYQFTGQTWKDIGMSKYDRLDPIASTEGAIKLANRNGQYLENKLGRAPTDAEIYMAHNIGPGGAYKLLTVDPNTPVTKALIGSNPKYNPHFLTNRGRTITAGQAVQKYYDAFGGTGL